MACIDENVVFDEIDVTLHELRRRMDEILWEVGAIMIMEGSRVNSLRDVHYNILM
ncbi:hypothetical protein DPMN_028313 [Dreissena polymorpha]|uniref:Uncharacterized protein n=1 Tax=Dreissena polymorpha TaxID=45954 RepID=A0A9D4REG2_DREPO|nr:hypothetical protein DPMN_028313 [Dreissena polymorpha]